MKMIGVALVALVAAVGGCGDADRSSGEDPTGPGAGEGVGEWTAPPDYRFDVESRCGEQSLIGAIRIVVEKGDTVRAEGLDEPGRRTVEHMGAEIPTLSELHDYARQAESEGAEVVDVVYDEDDGHPTSIEFDYRIRAVDDESCYTITGYKER